VSTDTTQQDLHDVDPDRPVEPIVAVTDEALSRILALRAEEADADELALWLEITGVTSGGAEYQYDMFFEPLGTLPEGMEVRHHGDLPLAVPGADVSKLRGATLDVPGDPGQPGLTLRNPNRPDPMVPGAGGDAPAPELSGTVSERIEQLLALQINPAIAAHGGFAELAAVEDDTAYVRLSGGCQGCAMSRVTVAQGIERAVLTYVPEITKVIDTTDHAEGTNPYYEQQPLD
jgi:Fe/S biogenesis protein NfuA